MGRHKTTGVSDEGRAELYRKYIEPNHKLVRTTVNMLTHKKTDISDTFQEICMHLLRYVDTYDPKQKISTWIITACRREVGKIEARRDSYTDATKGSDTEYETTHSGYKKKYRPQKAKDFVNVYDENFFIEETDVMSHDGIEDDKMCKLRSVLPTVDFGGGSYKEILSSIRNCEDDSVKIYFMKEFDGETYKSISDITGISTSEIKRSYIETRSRLGL